MQGQNTCPFIMFYMEIPNPNPSVEAPEPGLPPARTQFGGVHGHETLGCCRVSLLPGLLCARGLGVTVRGQGVPLLCFKVTHFSVKWDGACRELPGHSWRAVGCVWVCCPVGRLRTGIEGLDEKGEEGGQEETGCVLEGSLAPWFEERMGIKMAP